MALMSSQSHPIVRKYPRTSGFAFLTIGFVLFYFSIVEPIIHAHVGEVIKLSGKGGFGGGIFVIVGLLFMLLGPRLVAWNKTSAAASQKPAFVLGGILGVIGIIAMEVTKSYLRSKGYILP